MRKSPSSVRKVPSFLWFSEIAGRLQTPLPGSSEERLAPAFLAKKKHPARKKSSPGLPYRAAAPPGRLEIPVGHQSGHAHRRLFARVMGPQAEVLPSYSPGWVAALALCSLRLLPGEAPDTRSHP